MKLRKSFLTRYNMALGQKYRVPQKKASGNFGKIDPATCGLRRMDKILSPKSRRSPFAVGPTARFRSKGANRQATALSFCSSTSRANEELEILKSKEAKLKFHGLFFSMCVFNVFLMCLNVCFYVLFLFLMLLIEFVCSSLTLVVF